MAYKEDLCYKSTAIELLGLTRTSFEKLGLEPKKTVNNRGRKGNAYLFDRALIKSLVGTQKVLDLQPKKRTPKNWDAVFLEKYGNAENALKDGCDGLFNLNRYVKHPKCTDKNRSEIYDLKNKIIEILYKKGLSTNVHLHKPAKPCFSCNGTGKYYAEKCKKCFGDGIYLTAKTIQYYVFSFEVDGQKFTWHQPFEMVNYEVELTGTEQEMNDFEVKEVFLNSTKRTAAKALLKFIVKNLY